MRSSSSYVFGILLVLVGVVFFLDNLGMLDFDWVWNNLWPIILIAIGVLMLGRRGRRRRRVSEERSAGGSWSAGSGQGVEGDYLSESQVFGGIRRGSSSKNFSGGKCSVVFGEIQLDLTQIELRPGEQVLRLDGVFGSVRLELPQKLEFAVKGAIFAGSLIVKGDRRGGLFQNSSFHSEGYATASNRLLIQTSSVFGEVRII